MVHSLKDGMSLIQFNYETTFAVPAITNYELRNNICRFGNYEGRESDSITAK